MATENPNYVKIHPLFYAAAGVIIITGLKMGAPIINPILMAVFFSIIILQPIKWLKDKGVHSALSIIIVVFSLLVVFFAIGGAVKESVIEFSKNLPTYKEQLNDISESSITLLNGYGIDVTADSVASNINAGSAFSYASKFIGGVGGVFGQIVLLLLVAAFIIGEATSFPVKLKVILKNPTVSLDNITTISKNIMPVIN